MLRGCDPITWKRRVGSGDDPTACAARVASDNGCYRGMQVPLSERELDHLYGLRVYGDVTADRSTLRDKWRAIASAGFRIKIMSNPWLNIPLADYEGHMRSDEVQQLDALSELFAAALERCQPTSVAVLGVGGGNGLDRIDSRVTKRVVGLDLNQHYLDEARKRYGGTCNLSLHCVDLAEERVELEPVHLVHAALVFEHAGIDRCLENAVSLVDGAVGALCAVLQLPSQAEQEIGSTNFSSMLTLKDNFALVDPISFQRKLASVGFRMVHEVLRPVPAGKGLWMAVFKRY